MNVTVRKVISILSFQQSDQAVVPMDVGLDSLGSTEQSDALQSQLGVGFPSIFVLNNPTAMSQHLHSQLSLKIDTSNERGMIGTRGGVSSWVVQLSILGMNWRFPGVLSITFLLILC